MSDSALAFAIYILCDLGQDLSHFQFWCFLFFFFSHVKWNNGAECCHSLSGSKNCLWLCSQWTGKGGNLQAPSYSDWPSESLWRALKNIEAPPTLLWSLGVASLETISTSSPGRFCPSDKFGNHQTKPQGGAWEIPSAVSVALKPFWILKIEIKSICYFHT